MQPKTSLALTVIFVALALGVVTDQLFRGGPWGINVILVSLLFLAAVAGISGASRQLLMGGGRGFAIPIVLFGAMFAWRDNNALTFFNTLALAGSLLLFVARGRVGRVLTGSISQRIADVVRAGLMTPFSGIALLPHLRGAGAGKRPQGALLLRILLGLVLAVPLLLVFGALFASADAGFEKLLRNLFDFNLPNIVERVVASLVLAWLCAGLLWQLFFDEHSPIGLTTDLSRFTLFGMVEISVVLGLLNVLFAAFVVSQLRYFFGGAALVMDLNDASNALTFAQYARRGFFELVAVSVLVLFTLLAAHRLTRFNSPRAGRVFGLLAGILIALLFVIMASALNRMRLYMAVYGLSEQRIYATAIMLWLAGVLGWFGWTTLRAPEGPGTRYFVFGAIISGLATLFLLNLLNPVDLIVRTNVERMLSFPTQSTTSEGVRRAERLDADYLEWLARNNADAVPALVSALSRLPPDDACVIARGLRQRDHAPQNWRHWNDARQRARAWLAPNQDMIDKLACPDRS
jgi:Domain of unknown function (DUF4173)